MKPFNLEEALAGKPVVTGDGIPVTQITKFDIESKWPIHGVYNGRLYSFAIDGKTGQPWLSSKHDLFMAPEIKEAWVNVYNYDGNIEVGDVYNSEAEAYRYRNKCNVECLKTICIHTWEE